MSTYPDDLDPDDPRNDYDPEMVDEDDACPYCGEARADMLACDEDDTAVFCQSCGYHYRNYPGGET